MDGQAFAREREELGWYFGGLGPTLGIAAGGIESSGGRIYDEKASERAHMHRRSQHHRHEMAQLELVQRAIVLSDRGRVLSQIFTPFGAGRATYRLMTAFMHQGQHLIGLAVETASLHRLIDARRFGQTEEGATMERASLTERLLLLENEVADLKKGNRIPTGHRLMSILDECVERLESNLSDYFTAKQQVLGENREERARARELRQQKYQRELVAVGLGIPSRSVGDDEDA